MKVKLLSDGGYSFMEGAQFPSLVDARRAADGMLTGVEVTYHEIGRIGAKDRLWRGYGAVYFSENEFEVIHE